jgi:hypothetical protein
MRDLCTIILLVLISSILNSQTVSERSEGSISFITTQNVYVKFKSTEEISVGDTLFIQKDNVLAPVLIVTNLSSISCVCLPVSSAELKVSDVVVTKQKQLISPEISPKNIIEPQPQYIETITDSVRMDTTHKAIRQDVNGRISISSYSHLSNSDAGNSQRMRYTLMYNVKNVAKSNLTFESYLSFAHSDKNWDEVQNNLFNGLKIYNLNLKYDLGKTTHLLFGRKINPRVSSVGAIDGLQFEQSAGYFTFGAFAGSRPDYRDYSFNFGLLQYGIYASHDHTNANGKGNMQTSIAVAQQTNGGNTDRRFAYFQHSNSLLKNLYFFGSVEMDLYKKVNEQASTTFNLSNLYLMLRYNVIKELSLSISYSARQNIIYYETYKDYIDRLLESEALKGFRLMANYHPAKNLSLGLRTGYRYRLHDPRPTKDLYGYVTYSRVPVLNISTTLSATIMDASYLAGNIFSLGINRELIPGKVSLGINYRFVNYTYYNFEFEQVQHVGEADIYWRIYKKLSFSVYYEGTLETPNTFHQIYANLGYRF